MGADNFCFLMKKTYLPTFVFLLSAPFIALGQTHTVSGFPPEEIYNSLLRVADWFFDFLVIGAVIGVLIGAGMLLGAGGEPGKIATAKKVIIYSLIAILIGSFSFALVLWVRNLFPDY